MKQVATAAGTSVGNLYNYYPSKPALFLAIRDRWKTSLLAGCRDILDGQAPRRDKVLAVLHRLYDDVSAWHGLWMEFLGGREERQLVLEDKARQRNGHPWGLGPEELALIGRLDALVRGTEPGPPPHRWAFLLITSTVQLAARWPAVKDENWRFLEALVDKV